MMQPPPTRTKQFIIGAQRTRRSLTTGDVRHVRMHATLNVDLIMFTLSGNMRQRAVYHWMRLGVNIIIIIDKTKCKSYAHDNLVNYLEH